MKPPKNRDPSVENQMKQLIHRIDGTDLSSFSVKLDKIREYRKLITAGEFEAADDFYIATIMGAIAESDRKEFQRDIERLALKKGGESRGKQKTDEANEIREWLYPLLTECDAELPPERKNRGWTTMQDVAKKKLNSENMDDTRKDLITQSRVQTWIDKGRPKNWSV